MAGYKTKSQCMNKFPHSIFIPRPSLMPDLRVTGSSEGIGRAIALLFSYEGAHVVCADIRSHCGPEDGQSNGEAEIDTHLYIRNTGASSFFLRTDVSVSTDVENLVHATVAEYGRLDIFVNNAGIFLEADNPQPIWTMPDDAWEETMRINARGVFLGCKHASAQMMRQEPHANGDRGWIVNTASIFGLVGQAATSAYCASKGAVVNLTKAAALDCAPFRIHVNAICPGYTATSQTEGLLRDPGIQDHLMNLHPFRGFGIPDDIARAALFLASEDASWLSGACIPVDGGYLAR
ncbi:hypothetical protein MBLNU457_7638t1 [Dothideomycetes sp. NU457]